MAFTINTILERLAQLGAMEFLVFILIFTIIFAVLDKTKILGEAKHNLNVGVALIFSLVVMVAHATGDIPEKHDPVIVISKALPQVSLIVVAVIALMILIGVFAHDRILLGLTAPGWVAIFSVVAIIFIFGSAAEWWTEGFIDWATNNFGEDILAIVVMILVFGIIIAFVTGGQEREEFGTWKKAGINLGKLFGGK